MSDSAIPRSPRYSFAQVSNANFCESRSRGPTAWHACRYSCAIVPSGVRSCRRARSTLEVPTNLGPMPLLSVAITSSCQSREKRLRVP